MFTIFNAAFCSFTKVLKVLFINSPYSVKEERIVHITLCIGVVQNFVHRMVHNVVLYIKCLTLVNCAADTDRYIVIVMEMRHDTSLSSRGNSSYWSRYVTYCELLKT